MKRKKLL